MFFTAEKCRPHSKKIKTFFQVYKNNQRSYIFIKGGDAVREVEVIIDTDEIAEFFFQELLKRGYVPIEGELDDLADITFEYLIEKCIIDEEIMDDTFIDENE